MPRETVSFGQLVDWSAPCRALLTDSADTARGFEHGLA
jgi:hypothetical protein